MSQKIGSHVSIKGGYQQAIERANALDEGCFQMFSSAPVRWAARSPSQDDIQSFTNKCNEHNLDPVYFHAPYLINLADDGQTGKKSVQALIEELHLAADMKIEGSVVHLGSFVDSENTLTGDEPGYNNFIGRIRSVLEKTPDDALFIAENSGTRKIGKDISGLAKVITDVGSERLRVCLDTCHLHAAGYDISTKPKLESFLDAFDTQIGLEKLELWHINDSKDELGSLRDRHANIGEGNIPDGVFENILNHPQTKDIPLILETPGFDTPYKDEKNIAALKQMIR